jgi:hypothetical protein
MKNKNCLKIEAFNLNATNAVISFIDLFVASIDSIETCEF